VYSDYKNVDGLRKKFNDFVDIVFPGANFEKWYRKGFWLDNYIPFSIVMDGKIVSNVSITRMNVLIDNRKVSAIQFGTVGTIPEYRGRGFSRYLMEYVLDKFRNSADFLFLFANENVLDFYPKFGFDRYSEMTFRSDSDIPKANFSARKLDIELPEDFAIIKRLVKDRFVLSRLFGALDYGFITWWHVLNIFSDMLYYIKEDDAILIARERNQRLHIWDAIYSQPININFLISKIITDDNLKSIRYYFSPDQLGFQYDSVDEDASSPLFILGKFPLKGRNYKFPSTAQT